MPVETNLHTTAKLAPIVPATYIKDTLLERSYRDLVFWAICRKSRIPQGEGKTCEFHRFEKLPLPEAPLQESVTPTATPMTVSTVQAVLDQWGAVVSFSDIAGMTIRHPLLQEARDLLSEQHNETLDREVQIVAMASTAVGFPGTVTARSGITGADIMTSTVIAKQVATLRSNGARPFEGNVFRGVIDPFVEADLNKDAVFQAAGQNLESQVRTLRMQTIGQWLGVMWERSNMIPRLSLMTATDVTYAADTTPPAGTTGFDAGSTVRVKTTRLDAQTKFETVIEAESAVTNAAAFSVEVTIPANSPTGTYKIYATLQDGATGTATLQVRVAHAGVAQVIQLVKSGTPPDALTFVVGATGAVAPPDPPSGVIVHTSYIFGRGALGATELGNLQTYLTPSGASDSDPLGQRRKAGWKQMFKAVILNPDFFRRIESASDQT